MNKLFSACVSWLRAKAAAKRPRWFWGKSQSADAPHCDYGWQVTSDSMEPLIRKGDMVLIRSQDDVEDGQIAAVRIDDSASLNRVFHIPGGLQLLSENTAKYPPRIVTFAEFSTLRILGRVVAVQRNL